MKYLLVHKTRINTHNGKEAIKGEWDFVKGGVEEGDKDLRDTLMRELKEETGSTEYKIVKQFDEIISFPFPTKLKKMVGYDKQETTMFLVEFLGDTSILIPNDIEIGELQFVEKEKVTTKLTHQETKEYFIKYVPSIDKPLLFLE
ncbi:NUDIX hydrolase [Bacillus spongiae]|uniref:NUDIX hydrolase n=1 Tax=Bacillus spongiae TaxID=2683610 RepID=A0ABU8HJA2_9BACI